MDVLHADPENNFLHFYFFGSIMKVLPFFNVSKLLLIEKSVFFHIVL